MLQTIEVEIDMNGHIHPLEPLPLAHARRAYLTLLPNEQKEQLNPAQGTAAQALALLASPRFTQRPEASPTEVQQRIDNLRNDWTDR